MDKPFPRIGSALLVRDNENKILLGKRNKDPQRGSWVIPGGKIRPFESIGDAAARELREETGLEVTITGQFRVYEIISPPDEHRIVIYSWGRLVGGTAKASDDLSELAFFSTAELYGLQISPLVRNVLTDAGFLIPNPSSLSRTPFQLTLCLMPTLVDREKVSMGGKLDSRQRRRRSVTRASKKLSAPTLFDSSLSS